MVSKKVEMMDEMWALKLAALWVEL